MRNIIFSHFSFSFCFIQRYKFMRQFYWDQDWTHSSSLCALENPQCARSLSHKLGGR